MVVQTAVSSSLSRFSSFIEVSNLTDLQLLYWIGHTLRPSATHFNNAFSFTFATSLCPQQFKDAFATAVAQHDALRTIIVTQDGVPKSHILPAPPAELDFVDLSADPPPLTALEKWQQQRIQRPFLLERCLYDAALIKLGNSHYTWFLNQHHLITDAASFFLIAETVLEAYSRLRRGGECLLVEKPSFVRYAAAQERIRHTSRAEKSHTFWQEKLAQKPELFNFYGRSSPKSTNQVTRWTHNLGSKQTAQLIALAEAVDLDTATTSELRQFCLTAALFFSLLHQISGSLRPGFVTTIHNRSTQVNRQTVGVLMELCPVVVTLDPEETFVSLMQKVAAEMKQLLLHYRHGASQAASDLALDVIFTFVQRPLLTFDNQLIEQQIVHPGTGSERLGLHVHYLAASGRYELYLDLHQDIFTPAQQAHVQQSLQALLTAVLQNPGAPIAATALPWPPEEIALAKKTDRFENGRSHHAYAPPTMPLETALQQVWQEVLGRSPLGIHDDFFALGGESWQAMSFLSKFEAMTGHYLPLTALLRASTIAGLARQIEQAAPPESIIEIQPGSPGVLPLFLIPGAAGNTLAMSRLARHLPVNQPVYTFQMPPLENDKLPPAEVALLAKYYLSAIQSVQPNGPYYLCGYSAGGILAYEVAQQLQAQNEAVPFLAILDMPAPNPAYKYWWHLSHFLANWLHLSASREETIYLFGRDYWSRAAYFWGRGLKVWLRQYGRYAHRIWQMPLKQKWNQFKQYLKRQPVSQPASRRPALRDMDPASLTDPRARTLFAIYDRAARKYLPQPYPGRLTLLRCPLGYGRKEISSPLPHYGWQKLAQRLDIHVVNANGHLALLQEPAVAEVGQKLQTALSQAIEKENG